MPSQTPLSRLLAQPGVAREPGVFLFGPLLTAQVDLLGVDHHDGIAAQHVRSVRWAMLAHQNHRDLTRQPADDLVRRIDDVPLLFDLAWLGQKRLRACHGKLSRRQSAAKSQKSNHVIYRWAEFASRGVPAVLLAGTSNR